MFKKNSILFWIILLVIFVGIYIAVEYTSSADRTFRSRVSTFDTEKISSIVIRNPGEEALEITREGEDWKLQVSGKKFKGEAGAIERALEMLNNMMTERVVATKEDKWEEYKVDKNQAVIVELYDGDDRAEKIYIGKFDFKQMPTQNPQQPQTKATSFVRTEGDKMVFAVNGILRMNFQEGKQSFRDRTLFNCNGYDEIDKVSISSMNDKIELDLSSNEWTMNGSPVDSLSTLKYLRSLSRLNSSGFLDDVNVSGMTPAFTVRIEGSTFAPVSLQAYPADTLVGHYVTSTANPGTVFDGSKSRLFEKTFVGKEAFLPE
ncbi:MAG: DUF4340 domain-containing protein [Bacteroidales bacterium]|jgi:hypothetical protein|nr:DUF4340 domain-containing protein [Bacteroidales bacterium]